MAGSLQGKKVAILAADMVKEAELEEIVSRDMPQRHVWLAVGG